MIVPQHLRDRIDQPHRQQIQAKLGPIENGTYTPGIPGLLVLCFTNRCGSNYLAALLASTGAFNEAGEYFNADVVLHHAAARNLTSFRQYTSILPSLVAGAQNWLVAKASLDQLILLADAGILAKHPSTHFIFLERQNTLAQAISRCIAAQNDRWTHSQTAEMPDSALIYDRTAIDLTIQDVATTNAGFRHFFMANNITPIHLAHEELVRDPTTVIAQVGEHLEMPGLMPDPFAVRLLPQASALNAQWREWYQAGS